MSHGTWVAIPGSHHRFRLQGYYPLWRTFPGASANGTICNFPTPMQRGPDCSHNTDHATPARLTHGRFGLFPFRSPLLRKSWLLSFPEGTEMVHFPSFASNSLFDSGADDTVLPVSGFPIRKSPDQSLFAAPRGLSQLTTSFIAVLRQGIHRVPLVA